MRSCYCHYRVPAKINKFQDFPGHSSTFSKTSVTNVPGLLTYDTWKQKMVKTRDMQIPDIWKTWKLKGDDNYKILH